MYQRAWIMIVKFKYAISLFCFFSLFLWNFPSQVIAMDDQSIHTYLKENLSNEERHNPPFFKLTTSAGREIYILGSYHNRHPEMLLAGRNYQTIQGLLHSGAVLFIEHHTPYDQLLGELLPVANDHAPNIWNVSEISLGTRENTWNHFKEQDFKHHDIKIEEIIKIKYIEKMDKIKGLILFYEHMLDKGIEITLGFESTLVGWEGWKEIIELEDLELSYDSFKEHQEEAVSFFYGGLNSGRKIIDYHNKVQEGRKHIA